MDYLNDPIYIALRERMTQYLERPLGELKSESQDRFEMLARSAYAEINAKIWSAVESATRLK